MVGFTVNYDHRDFIRHEEGRIRGTLDIGGDVQVNPPHPHPQPVVNKVLLKNCLPFCHKAGARSLPLWDSSVRTNMMPLTAQSYTASVERRRRGKKKE